MNTQQQEILNWWNSGRDYNAGISLFSQHGKNRGMLNTFLHGNPKRYQETLEYQLTKSVGLNCKNMEHVPETKKPVKLPLITPKQALIKTLSETVEDPFFSKEKIETYPKVMSRLVREYADLSNERAILHNQMVDVPTENSAENMTLRADLLERIITHSARLEFLYPFIEEYRKNRVLPDEDTLWPYSEPEVDLIIELPDDIIKLKELKKNLQTNNTKDRNMLLYGQKKKGDKPIPIPDGPRRRKLELRIEARVNQIQTIESKLVELEHAR